MYLNTNIKEECYGCSACEQICPKGALKMIHDTEGFLFPFKNMDLCINCGLCEKVCPYNAFDSSIETSPKVYAAYLKDVEERKKSASGGLFFAIATCIIDNGGIVYGAHLNRDFKLKHIGVNSKDQLYKLRGSKYVQSDINNTYCKIKSDLQKDKWVYFVGTPCQVAGLKCFLRKPYDKLLTSDLVCHGTPSQLLFDNHLAFLRDKEKKEIISYQFRKNDNWKVNEVVTYRDKTGKSTEKISPGFEFSPYLYAFMNGYTYRLSCYKCQFAKVPRVGDITLADFWGVKAYFHDLDLTSGVSLILINTSKGSVVWEKIRGQCIYRTSNVIDASKFNHNLINKTIKPEIRSEIYNEIKKNGYKSIVRTKFRTSHWIFKYCLKSFFDSNFYLFIKQHIK